MFYVILFQQIGKKKNDGMNGAERRKARQNRRDEKAGGLQG